MRYVLDSNVALTWVLIEADSDKARRLRDDRLVRALQPSFPFIKSLSAVP